MRHPSRHRPICRLALCLVFAVTFWAVAPAGAEDWPAFRGPHRDGVTSEKLAFTQWPAGGPRQLWKARLGQSSSGVSVVGGRLYTMGFAPDLAADGTPRKPDDGSLSIGHDTIWCLDAGTGAVLWKHIYPARCDTGYGGTFCTPTVAAERCYTLSRDGQVHCLDAATGKVVWRLDLTNDFAAPIPTYGFSCSPLLTAGVLIVNCGGKRAATLGLDPRTGKEIWRWGGGDIHYASPVAVNAAGTPSALIVTPRSTVALAAADGRELWPYPFDKARGESSCATPIVLGGGRVLLNGTWDGRKTTLLRLDPRDPAGPPAVLWENRELLNFVQAGVVAGDHLYAAHSTNDNPKAALFKCIHLDTGAVAWEQKGLGQAAVIAAGNTLIITTDQGDLVLARASPNAYEELARAQPLPGRTAVAPVLANGRLYCRNNAGDLVCLNGKAP